MCQTLKIAMRFIMKKMILTVLFLSLGLSPRVFATSLILPTLHFPLGVAHETLDPTEAEDFITIRILMNLGSGLMAPDKNLKPQKALAQSYEVSKDKKTFTFKLKKAFWSDGQPIT